jgi:hypothetical protein
MSDMSIARKILVTAGCALALAGANVTPASATAENWDYCDSSRVCLYDGPNGTNNFLNVIIGCNSLFNIGWYGYGDRTTSVFNNEPHPIRLDNWDANAQTFEPIYYIGAGSKITLPASANNIADAVEMIC